MPASAISIAAMPSPAQVEAQGSMFKTPPENQVNFTNQQVKAATYLPQGKNRDSVKKPARVAQLDRALVS